MKEEARLKLEYVIKELDKASRPPDLGSWKAQVEEKAKVDDEETLRKTYFYLNVIMHSQQGLEDAIGKMLVGENILTPSLTTKGWMFWRQPLLVENQRKAVDSAVVRWSEAKVVQLDSLRDALENSPNEDDSGSGIIFMASVLDITSSCMQQLSADLKEILASTENV